MAVNNLSLMTLTGAIAAVGLWTNTLHLVIGSIWSTVTPAGIIVSILAAAAGALVVSGLREELLAQTRIMTTNDSLIFKASHARLPKKSR